MLPMVSKESGKACFNTIMSWTGHVVQGAVALVDCTFRTDFREMIALGVNSVQVWKVYFGDFALSTFHVCVMTITNLQGSHLPLATKVLR